MKIIKNKNSNLKLSDIKVFVCAPGLGKTHLDSINKNYMDIDRLRSKFKYGKDDSYTVEKHEAEKGLSIKKPVKTSIEILEYSMSLILNNINNNVISLIAPNEDIVEKINELKIPYAIVFIDPSIIKIMKERLEKRGNNKKFIEEMYSSEITKNYYNKDVNDLRPTYKIIFNKNEFISDIIDNINYMKK